MGQICRPPPSRASTPLHTTLLLSLASMFPLLFLGYSQLPKTASTVWGNAPDVCQLNTLQDIRPISCFFASTSGLVRNIYKAWERMRHVPEANTTGFYCFVHFMCNTFSNWDILHLSFMSYVTLIFPHWYTYHPRHAYPMFRLELKPMAVCVCARMCL